MARVNESFEPFNDMYVPVLELKESFAGEVPALFEPRHFIDMTFKGAYKCLEAAAGNPIWLSDVLYKNMKGIEELMQMNERRSPFDFEEDDVVVVIEQSPFESLTNFDAVNESDTQPNRLGKQTDAKLSVDPSSDASVAYNATKREHVVIDKKVGHIIF